MGGRNAILDSIYISALLNFFWSFETRMKLISIHSTTLYDPNWPLTDRTYRSSRIAWLTESHSVPSIEDGYKLESPYTRPGQVDIKILFVLEDKGKKIGGTGSAFIICT